MGDFNIEQSDPCNKNVEHIFSNLKYDLRNVLDLFKINSMKAIPGKFQFLIF